MEELAKILGLYNVVSYFIPGLVAVWAFLAALRAYRTRNNVKSVPRIRTTTVLVAAFIIGHMIQAVASTLDDQFFRRGGKDSVEAIYMHDTDGDFKKALIETITAAFKTYNPVQALRLCEIYDQTHQRDSYNELFLANRALFRGLTISLAFAFVAYIYVLIHSEKKALLRLLVFGMALACVISFFRFKKFNRYWADSIYRTFYIEYKFPSEKQPSKAGD